MIKNGGKDLTRLEGQIKQGETEALRRTYNLKAAQQELARIEKRKLTELKGRLQASIETVPALKPFKNQLLIDITVDGLRVQIVDEKNRPMFAMCVLLVGEAATVAASMAPLGREERARRRSPAA